MRRVRFGAGFAIVTLSSVVAACSASSSSPADVTSPDAGVALALEGAYDTTSDGPISELYFVDDTHVDVTWLACDDGDPCVSSDTFQLNDAQTELTLYEPDGKTNVLTVTSLELEPLDDPLRLQGGSGGASLTGGSDGGAKLTADAGTLTHGSKRLVKSVAVKLTNGCAQLFTHTGTFGNDKTVFDFFRSKGLSAVQAAAIVGNFDQESGDSPSSVQPGGPGRGIAQWSNGARWNETPNDNLASYAKENGGSTSSLQTQLNFSWYELSSFSRYGLASLKQQTSLVSAAKVFSTDFEACGTCDQTKRDSYGQTAYNAFASDPVGGSSATCGGTSGYGSCTASGQSGTCISTKTCGGKKGKSTAGHCPGPASIECCTGEKN